MSFRIHQMFQIVRFTLYLAFNEVFVILSSQLILNFYYNNHPSYDSQYLRWLKPLLLLFSSQSAKADCNSSLLTFIHCSCF